MSRKWQAATFFFIAGIVGAVIVVTGLHFANRATLPSLVGGSRLLAMIVFPLAGAVTAAVAFRFEQRHIGWIQGIQISVISFLVLAIVYGVILLLVLLMSGRQVSPLVVPLYIWGLVRFGVPFVILPLGVVGAVSGAIFWALTNQSKKAPASQAGTH